MRRLRRLLRHPTLWTTVASSVALIVILPMLMAPGFADTPPTGTRHFDGSGIGTMQPGEDPTQQVEGCTFTLSAEATVDEAATSGPADGSFDCTIGQEAIDLGLPFAELHATIADFEDLAGDPQGVQTVLLHGTAQVTTPGGATQSVPLGLRLAEGSSDGGGPLATLRIYLSGVWDGKPGDREDGNGRYDMAVQTVADGSVDISYEEASPSPEPTTEPPPTTTPPPTTPPSPKPTHTTPPPPPPGNIDPGGGGGGGIPPAPTIGPPPYDTTGPWSTAQLMAILAAVSPTGQPQMSQILQVIGRFPVAGLASWSDDWHAYRCCPTPHLHQGVDISAALGTPVVASADGYVSEMVDHPDSSGQAVQINDPVANIQYWYMHLSAYAPGLHVGQTVHIGEVLGYVGDSGNPLPGAYHLHFEVRPNGVAVPPIPYVNSWLQDAEQAAYNLAGPGYYTEETFPYAITDAELQLWLDQAAALAHDTSGEGDLLDPAASPSPGASPAAPVGGATAAAAIRSPSRFGAAGLLAAVSLLVCLTALGVLGGRRQANVARATLAGRIGAPAPEQTRRVRRSTAPADASEKDAKAVGGSAAVAAR